MGAIQARFAARGLQVVQGSLNPDPRIPDFIRNYGVNFPIGLADPDRAREFMQISVMQQNVFIPWFAVIDRKGMIRTQHFGGESLFQDNELQKMTHLLEKFLAEPAAGAGKKR